MRLGEQLRPLPVIPGPVNAADRVMVRDRGHGVVPVADSVFQRKVQNILAATGIFDLDQLQEKNEKPRPGIHDMTTRPEWMNTTESEGV